MKEEDMLSGEKMTEQNQILPLLPSPELLG